MKNYFLKSILRGFRKQKMVMVINLLGLSFGLALVMFISIYLANEVNADKFHKNLKFIYRVDAKVQSTIYPITADPLANWLKQNFPEIELSSRIFTPFFKTLQYVTVNNNSFEVEKPLFVDPSFFQIFTFPVASGKISEQSSNNYSVILTEPLAKKLFGSENPVGKTLSFCGKNLFTVTAVLEELPANSTLQFDILFPFNVVSDYSKFKLNNWNNSAYQTIVLTKSAPALLNDKITNLFNRQFPNSGFKYSLTSLSAIHFSQDSVYDLLFNRGSKAELILFLIVALCVLFIAVINFVNMSIALSALRVKEIGIHKIEGATRSKLLIQLVGESVLVSVASAIIALFLIELFFPVFNNLLQNPITRSLIRDPKFYAALAGLGLMTGLIAGIYPAIKFSSMPVTAVLQSKKTLIQKRKWDDLLLVFQFTISLALIISSLFLNKQMSYIQTHELGFDKEHILYVPLSDQLFKQKDMIKEKLSRIPGVVHISSSDFIPGQTYSIWRLDLKAHGENREFDTFHTQVDPGYVKTLGLKIVQGRDFDPLRPSDRNKYLVNEAFIKSFKVDNISEISINGAQIIGLVKDFNFYSLHQNVTPLAIRLSDHNPSAILIRMKVPNVKDIQRIIFAIKACITEDIPDAFFDVRFMNNHIQSLYQKEIKTAYLLNCFTFFAILISCLGLFALALLTINNRTKEIGIRKVNGAKISEIMITVNKDFLKAFVLANVLALPVAYYAMYRWLQNFAYKTELSWWIFALAGSIALGIALLTVSWQSWKAATRNPVEALRYE